MFFDYKATIEVKNIIDHLSDICSTFQYMFYSQQICQHLYGIYSSSEPLADEPRWEFSSELSLPSLFAPPLYQERHLSSGLRRKRGIVDECCLRPCTLSTLRQYC